MLRTFKLFTSSLFISFLFWGARGGVYLDRPIRISTTWNFWTNQSYLLHPICSSVLKCGGASTIRTHCRSGGTFCNHVMLFFILLYSFFFMFYQNFMQNNYSLNPSIKYSRWWNFWLPDQLLQFAKIKSETFTWPYILNYLSKLLTHWDHPYLSL